MAAVVSPKPGPVVDTIAGVVARTLTAHKEQTAGVDQHHRDASREAFLEGLEEHLTPHVAAMLSDLADDPEAPAWIGPLLAEMRAPEHQFTALLQFAAIFLGIFGLAGSVLRPLKEKIEQDAESRTPHGLISPPDIALGLLRGVHTPFEPYDEAIRNGIDADRLDFLVGITGEPPGLMQLLEGYRRGFIDQGRLHHGIRQSRIRNEWIDLVEALRYEPMPPGNATAARVEGHIDQAVHRELIAQAGIDPKWAEIMYQTAGRPPGPEEMLHLWNRGKATQAEVEAAIRESDIKNKYVPHILELRRYIPPPRSIPTLLRHGSITKAKAHELFMWNGLDEELATAYVHSATAEKTQAHKELALGQVVALYTERAITEAKAREFLTDLDWAPAEQTFILWLADHVRERRFLEGAIGTVHARYIGHRIDRSSASSSLDTLHVPTPQRDDLLRLWDLEREASVRQLTESQIIGAYSRGLRPREWSKTRLVQTGLPAEDAELLLEMAKPPPAPTPGGTP